MRASAFIFLVACSGAPRPVVTVAPLATNTTAPPSVSASLVQAPPEAQPRRPTKIEGTRIRFEGGDGSSIDQAIVIKGASGERDGVAAEYEYLEMLYGPKGSGHDVLSQSLLDKNGRSFDMLSVRLVKESKSIDVYFDISDYFGKL